MIALSLPAPPSVNNLFFNLPRGGRAPSKPYRLWQKAAGEAVGEQRQSPIAGRTMVAITLSRKMRGDIDNYSKALLDLLVRHALIDDDRDIEALAIARAPLGAPIKGAEVRVWPMCADRASIRALPPESEGEAV